MDTRIKVLAFAFLLVLLLVPFWVSGYLLPGNRPSTTSRLGQSTADESHSMLTNRSKGDGKSSGQMIRQAKLDEATRRISSLETLLEKQGSLIDQRDDLLKEKDAECEELKNELDEYLLALVQVVEGDAVEDVDDSDDTVDGGTSSQSQLDELQSKLTRATSNEKGLQTEVAQLKEQLEAVNRRLTMYELAATLEKDQSVRLVSTDLVASMGANAVPSLIVLMSDKRAVIRTWAATTLGKIGPNAGDAAFVLRDATRDADAQVRAAARAALVEILD